MRWVRDEQSKSITKQGDVEHVLLDLGGNNKKLELISFLRLSIIIIIINLHNPDYYYCCY